MEWFVYVCGEKCVGLELKATLNEGVIEASPVGSLYHQRTDMQCQEFKIMDLNNLRRSAPVQR